LLFDFEHTRKPMEQLYEKYQNIQLFATDKQYRGYELNKKEKFYDYETFKTKMQGFEYVLHKFYNPKQDKEVDLYLFKPDSKYMSSTLFFKKILDRYNGHHNIIVITKEELNVYRKKSIKKYANLNIKNYLHKNFIIEINKGPLCSKHTILTTSETRALSFDIMAHGHNLNAIFDNDAQNIWIGGEINDVIRIDSISEMAGRSINYRIVTPASGKAVQNPATIIKKKAALVGDIDVAEEGDDKEPDNVISDTGEDYIDDYVESVIEDDDAS
jgi:DNA-directed RNA polymerase subunit H (RpoH/RPB5)